MSTHRSGIVADGRERNRGLEAQVRAEIEARYAEPLASATQDRAKGIRARIELEVRARLAEISARGSLY